MAKWNALHGVELLPCEIDNQEYDFALEQTAKIIYKWLLRFDFDSSKKISATEPNLQTKEEIRQ